MTGILSDNKALLDERFIAGLDFILSHVSGPTFPRHLSTAATKGAQFPVTSKQEILEAAARADYIDIRINAYPDYREYRGINRTPPDFLFIDLDRSTFKDDAEHGKALNLTLTNIKGELEGRPSVVWSGNGYHIYQPLDNQVILEQVADFADFQNPSVKFLRYAEQYLSKNKSDPSHKPSFKSCMLRIPGSFNGKCILAGKESEVRVIKRWDGRRPKLPLALMKDLRNYLLTEKINEIERLKEKTALSLKNNYGVDAPGTVGWIEILLQTPIEDYRKNALALIVAPYLVNIKRLSYSDAMAAIKEWLARCNQARRLDSYFDNRIKSALDAAIRDKTKPMRLSTLQSRNPSLYQRLKH